MGAKRSIYHSVWLGAVVFCISCGGGNGEVIDLPPALNLPSAAAPQLANPPGKGAAAGPATYTFWSKNRRANAPSGLAAYSQITAVKLAWSAHFVLYREESAAALMNNAQASTFVNYLETKWAQLRDTYGDGISPDLQQTGRIVILALDIPDDYATVGSQFVSGYFAPRDLFNDAYTAALFSNVPLIQSVSAETLADRAGHSNMLPMIYADLKPFFNADAFQGDQTKAQNLFREMLLHELSHLYTYYSRHIVRDLPRLNNFFAEGLAENAPMLVDSLFETQKIRLGDFSDPIVQSALREPVSLGTWSQNNSERAGYVRANLFFNYLRHRLSPNANGFYRQLAAGNGNFSSLDASLTAGGITGGLSGLFYDFVLSLYASSGGYSIAAYRNSTGAPFNLSAGTPLILAESLSFSAAGIQKYNQGSVAFVAALNKAPVPQANAPASCLPPLSFQIYPYYTLSGETFSPAALGAHPQLRFVVAYNPDTMFANTELRQYAASDSITLVASTISGGTLQNFYHIILINDQLGDACLSAGNLPRNINEGNVTAWLGGNQSGWQGGPGAVAGNEAAYFMRTAGMATNTAHDARTVNYVYTTDYLNHKVSRWNMNTGVFAGALGDITPPSANADCASDSLAQNGYKLDVRTYPNYCRRSFNSPRGVAVTSRGDIIVADTDNHRLVLYDAAGTFVAWLGDATSDSWQCVPGSPHPYCPGAGINNPVSTFSIPGAASDVRMFYYPWQLAVDEAGATKYVYVTSYGSSRVIRRNLETGAFTGFVGNGYEAWHTAASTVGGVPGAARKYLNMPTGIAHDETFIYVADSGNHRISRFTKAGAQSPEGFWGGNAGVWHDGATASGSDEGSLSFPSGMTLAELDGGDGNTYRYLLIADAGNHRISRLLLRRHEKANPANLLWLNTVRGWLAAGNLSWQSGANNFNYAGISTSLLFPPEFIYSPQAVLFVPASAAGFQRDYIFLTATYSARVSRWNLNCLWQSAELTIFSKNCTNE